MLIKTENVFATTGASKDDFWLVNGICDFGVIPAGVVPDFPNALPIRLHVGTPAYGAIHLEKHRKKWPRYISTQGISLVDVLYQKLGQTGAIFSAEEGKKCKINLTLNPNALLILEYRFNRFDVSDYYWSVTSFYPPHTPIDGFPLGRYPGVQGRNPIRR